MWICAPFRDSRMASSRSKDRFTEIMAVQSLRSWMDGLLNRSGLPPVAQLGWDAFARCSARVLGVALAQDVAAHVDSPSLLSAQHRVIWDLLDRDLNVAYASVVGACTCSPLFVGEDIEALPPGLPEGSTLLVQPGHSMFSLAISVAQQCL